MVVLLALYGCDCGGAEERLECRDGSALSSTVAIDFRSPDLFCRDLVRARVLANLQCWGGSAEGWSANIGGRGGELCDQLERLTSRGLYTFNSSLAEQCLQDLGFLAQRDSCAVTGFVPSCDLDLIYQPALLPAGQPCDGVRRCPDGSYCPDGCGSPCEPRRAAGAPCVGDVPGVCADGLVCSPNGICEERGSCTPGDCAEGFYCLQGGRCERPLSLGDPCSDDSFCGEGSICDSSQAGRRCRPSYCGSGGWGAECTGFWECAPGLDCSEEGRCEHWPTAGDRCSRAKFGCEWAVCRNGFCVSVPLLGDRCGEFDPCLVGTCLDGICQAACEQ